MYASPGMLMNVSALVSVATTENRTAQPRDVAAGHEVVLGVLLAASERHAERRRPGEIRDEDDGVEKGESATQAVNELPHPHPPVAFGFLNVKPEPCIDDT